MTKYVCCEDCDYKDCCEQFDPFFGCNSGKRRLLNPQPFLHEQEDSEIFVESLAKNMLNNTTGGIYYHDIKE